MQTHHLYLSHTNCIIICLWDCLNCYLTLFRLPAVLLIPLRPLGSSSISQGPESISVWGRITSLCLLVLTGTSSGPQTSKVITIWPHQPPDHENTPNSHSIFILTLFFSTLVSSVHILFPSHEPLSALCPSSISPPATWMTVTQTESLCVSVFESPLNRTYLSSLPHTLFCSSLHSYCSIW